MGNTKRRIRKRTLTYDMIRKRKCYLIGKNRQGYYLWMLEPTYDKDWGWLLGTILKFSNKRNPAKSATINFHDIESLMFDKSGARNTDLTYSDNLINTIFKNNEGRLFGELFERFTTLYKTRQMLSDENQKYCGVEFGRDITNEMRDKIDNVLMPPIIEKIEQILK